MTLISRGADTNLRSNKENSGLPLPLGTV